MIYTVESFHILVQPEHFTEGGVAEKLTHDSPWELRYTECVVFTIVRVKKMAANAIITS